MEIGIESEIEKEYSGVLYFKIPLELANAERLTRFEYKKLLSLGGVNYYSLSADTIRNVESDEDSSVEDNAKIESIIAVMVKMGGEKIDKEEYAAALKEREQELVKREVSGLSDEEIAIFNKIEDFLKEQWTFTGGQKQFIKSLRGHLKKGDIMSELYLEALAEDQGKNISKLFDYGQLTLICDFCNEVNESNKSDAVKKMNYNPEVFALGKKEKKVEAEPEQVEKRQRGRPKKNRGFNASWL